MNVQLFNISFYVMIMVIVYDNGGDMMVMVMLAASIHT